MDKSSVEFLKRLLNTPGPSGFEAPAAKVWRTEAEGFADRVWADVSGNSFATIEGKKDGPRIMLAGHIDEIGVIITHIDDDGYLYIDGIGGWDPQVLVGHRIRLSTRKGDVLGVIGKKPIHLIKGEEKEKASKMTDLWIDIGEKGKEKVLERGVRVGDSGVIDVQVIELGGDLLASRSVDNRAGAFVVLEALRLLAGKKPKATVTAVATVQEEIGFYTGGGASSGAYGLDPQVAVAVDVTFASDAPGIEKKETGEHKIGGGPVITRGSSAHPIVVEKLCDVAEAEKIPYTISAAGKYTSTDADAIYFSRAGVATGLVSVPNRYMHSPNEIVSVSDLESTAKLIAAFCRAVSSADEFIQG